MPNNSDIKIDISKMSADDIERLRRSFHDHRPMSTLIMDESFIAPNAKPDGGSAFPTSEAVGQVVMTTGGMSLRDYFAAHAPITMNDARDALISIGQNEFSGNEIIEMLVNMRSLYADAMLAAREVAQ